MTLRLLLVATVLVLSTIAVMGQQVRKGEDLNRFGFGILGGATFAQIDGDNYRGYSNVGLYAGLRGSIRLSERFEVNLELLYSQKGSKFESRAGLPADGKKARQIKLDYAEIPVLATYRLTGNQAKVHVWLEGGMSVARLINSDVMDSPDPSDQEFDFSEIEGEFDKTDVSVVAGVVLNAAPWLGFGLRGTWGVRRFYDNPDFAPSDSRETVEFLRNYSLSAFALYHF